MKNFIQHGGRPRSNYCAASKFNLKKNIGPVTWCLGMICKGRISLYMFTFYFTQHLNIIYRYYIQHTRTEEDI